VGVTGYESDLLCSPWYFGEADTHNANHDTRMAEIVDGAYVGLAECETGGDPALAPTYEREQAEGLVG
jgi:branched-chain amino acid transport system substrate-binding protein